MSLYPSLIWKLGGANEVLDDERGAFLVEQANLGCERVVYAFEAP